MQKTVELTCITCPVGCHLTATLDEQGMVSEVTGNSCPRGAAYAKAELTAPVRMVTSTVDITGAKYRRLPVITSVPIPKDKIFDVMREIRSITVCAPVKINDIIIRDVCGLDCNIIASRSL